MEEQNNNSKNLFFSTITKYIYILIIFISIFTSIIVFNMKDIIFGKEIKSSIINNNCSYYNFSEYGPEDLEVFNDDYFITSTGNILYYTHFGDKKIDDIPSGNIYLIPRNNNINEENKGNESKIPISLKISNYSLNTKLFSHSIYFNQKSKFLYIVNHAYSNGGDRIDRFYIDLSSKQAQYKD